MRTYDYIVKEDEKVVVCIMTVWSDAHINPPKFRFSGVAKCSPEDTFDAETGKKIAQRRALIKFKKACIKTNKATLRLCQGAKSEIELEIEKHGRAISKIQDAIERIQGEIEDLA